MKTIIAIIALIFSIYIGYKKADKYRLKFEFYYSFSQFNKKISNEVSFSQKTILMIVKDIKTENEFYNAVKSYLIDNIRFENKLFLTEELDFFNDYCICVGKGDKESQIAYLNSVQNVINEKLALATEENNKYKTLYVKLGILIGLMLFIAII